VVLAALDPGSSSHESEDTPSDEEEDDAPAPEQGNSRTRKEQELSQLSSTVRANLRELEAISRKWAEEGQSKDKERETVFVWMDGRKWGKWLKNMYGIKDVSKAGVDSGVVIVDHQVRGRFIWVLNERLIFCLRASCTTIRMRMGSLYILTRIQCSLHSNLSISERGHQSIVRTCWNESPGYVRCLDLVNRMLMTPFQSANNKVQAIEEYVGNHVKTTIFGVVLFFVLVFYALKYGVPFPLYCSILMTVSQILLRLRSTCSQ